MRGMYFSTNLILVNAVNHLLYFDMFTVMPQCFSYPFYNIYFLVIILLFYYFIILFVDHNYTLVFVQELPNHFFLASFGLHSTPKMGK